jgi:3-dehydroquinate synthase
MRQIPVEVAPRRYVVSVGRGLLGRLPQLLSSFRGRSVVLVASRRVHALYGQEVEKGLRRLGRLHVSLVPDGERFKSRRTLESLYEVFLSTRLGRDGLVVALGGGVVGDLTGYAAATYMRGVDWVGLPTTLLSMVDSSVGGKVGINHPAAKNLIGAFHQPRAVVADTAALQTLPRRELRAGAYEVLKCGVLGDRALFSALQEAPAGLDGWAQDDVDRAIAAACAIKADVVARDEREGGLRRVLNLGHTLGHALESTTRYRRFTHGEAVGWGLIGAAEIAHGRGLLSARARRALTEAVDHVGPRPRISDLPVPDIVAALGRDKKVKAGRVVFVLPRAIGRVTLHDDVTRPEVRRALKAMAARER